MHSSCRRNGAHWMVPGRRLRSVDTGGRPSGRLRAVFRRDLRLQYRPAELGIPLRRARLSLGGYLHRVCDGDRHRSRHCVPRALFCVAGRILDLSKFGAVGVVHGVHGVLLVPLFW